MDKEAGVLIMFYFIVNPKARSAQGGMLWDKASEILTARNVEYEAYFTEYPGHATELARQISLLSIPCTLVVVGGDGTLNEVINGLAEKDFSHITLGYIPTGSGNDFARGLGLATDLEAGRAAILSPSKYAMADIGLTRTKENKRYFLVSSGIGYDASICAGVSRSSLKKALNKAGLGKLSYVLIALKLLAGYRPCPVSIRLDKKEVHRFSGFFFTAVMNMKYEGGGVKFCPQAQYDDGRFHICLVEKMPKLKILTLFPTAFFGKHTGFKGIHMLDCRRIDIISKEPLPIHCDGEVLDNICRVSMINTQKQIKVILQ